MKARDKITSLMDKPIVANSGPVSYIIDIERRCQSRVQRDYLPLSQRLILSTVSKIDFQSRWFDLLLLQSPLECRFNALDRYSDEQGEEERGEACAKSRSKKQTRRMELVHFFNGYDICIDDRVS